MMNKRNLELYRQAQVPDTAIDPSNNMPYETTRFSADKFAELIVKECAEFVDYRLTNPDGASMAWCDGSDIKQHFGVEE